MEKFEFSEKAQKTIKKMKSWSLQELIGCRDVALDGLYRNCIPGYWRDFLFASIVEFDNAIKFKLDEEEEKLLRRIGEL